MIDSDFKEEFQELLMNIIESSFREILENNNSSKPTMKEINDIAKSTLDLDKKLSVMISVFSSMAMKSQDKPEIKEYCNGLSELIMMTGTENIKTINKMLEELRFQKIS